MKSIKEKEVYKKTKCLCCWIVDDVFSKMKDPEYFHQKMSDSLSKFSLEDIQLFKQLIDKVKSKDKILSDSFSKIQSVSEDEDRCAWKEIEFNSKETQAMQEFLEKNGENGLSEKLLKKSVFDLDLVGDEKKVTFIHKEAAMLIDSLNTSNDKLYKKAEITLGIIVTILGLRIFTDFKCLNFFIFLPFLFLIGGFIFFWFLFPKTNPCSGSEPKKMLEELRSNNSSNNNKITCSKFILDWSAHCNQIRIDYLRELNKKNSARLKFVLYIMLIGSAAYYFEFVNFFRWVFSLR